MKKALLLLTWLLLTALLLVACGGTEIPGEEGPVGVTADGDLVFLDGGESLFQVTYPMGANRNQTTGASFADALTKLRRTIKELGYTGDLFPIKDDEVPFSEKDTFVAPEYEILLGEVDRTETEGVPETLAYNEAIIRVVGKKVIVVGATDILTIQATHHFIDNYLKVVDGRVVIPKTLDEKIYLDLSYCQSTEMTYEEMAKDVFDSFNKRYWNGTQLLKETGPYDFWQPAEMLETYIDVYEATKTEANKQKMISLASAFVRLKRADWSWNEFNDDIMWACIAFACITILTGDERWIGYAKDNFDKAWASEVNNILGGGMYWKKDHKSKNACVNGPAAIAACLIGQYTKDDSYYEKAKQLIDWMTTKLYQKGTGKVYDSIAVNGDVGDWSSTYNQGTFLGACTFLWKHYNDETYLGYANKAADYAIKKLTSGGILNNGEASTTNGDLPGFKGILVRWLYRLAKETNNVDYLVFLQNNAAAAYKNRNSDGLIWTAWGSKTPDSDTLKSENGYVVYGVSTAVALMYNCQQWW